MTSFAKSSRAEWSVIVVASRKDFKLTTLEEVEVYARVFVLGYLCCGNCNPVGPELFLVGLAFGLQPSSYDSFVHVKKDIILVLYTP